MATSKPSTTRNPRPPTALRAVRVAAAGLYLFAPALVAGGCGGGSDRPDPTPTDAGVPVDAPPLTLEITRPDEGARLGGWVPVDVAVANGEGDDLELRVDGEVVFGPVAYRSGVATLGFDAEALDEGEVVLAARAGAVESAPVTVELVWRGPAVFVDGLPDGPVPRGVPIELSLACSRPPCDFDCRLDGGSFAPCGPTLRYDDLSIGEHTLEIVATDARGRTTVPPLTAVLEVSFGWQVAAAGDGAGCAITAGGALYCWGATAGGRTGLGAVADPVVPRPTPVAEGRRFAGVALDRFGRGTLGCAIDVDGGLWCWGGLAGLEPDLAPVSRAADLDFRQVSIGGAHACAITVDGDLHCGGVGDVGQLGRPVDGDAPVPLGLTDDTRPWDVVSAGDLHTCALAEGTLYCFGDDSRGAVGVGDGFAVTTPTRVGTRDGWRAVATGRDVTCGVRGEAGELLCWGDGRGGVLGVPSFAGFRQTPTPVVDGGGFVDVAIGRSGFRAPFACALRDDGEVWCWGSDDGAGVLGRAFEGPRETVFPTPAPVPGLRATAITAAGGRVCAVDLERQVRCWGTPATDRDDLALSSPSSVELPAPLDARVFQAAYGPTHGCGVFGAEGEPPPGGALRCWGANDRGGLGTGDRVARARATAIGEDDDWVHVAVAADQTCALRDDERLFCWGDDAFGELGQGDAGAPGGLSTEPLRVDGRYVDVAVSDDHACAIRAGQLWCWGRNDAGQLGLGDTEDRASPARVGDAEDWARVFATSGRTCALRADDAVWCWGVDGLAPRSIVTTPRPLAADLRARDLALSPAGDALVDDTGTLRVIDYRAAAPTLVEVDEGRGEWNAVGLGGGVLCALRGGLPWCADGGLARPTDLALAVDDRVFVQLVDVAPLSPAGPSGTACARAAGDTRLCWGVDPTSLHGRGYARWRPIRIRAPAR